MKKSFFASLIGVFSLTACIKPIDVPAPIIDPVTYGSAAVWQEISKGADPLGYEMIADGRLLHMWWNTQILEGVGISLGAYYYESPNFLSMNKEGMFKIENGLISFYNFPAENIIDTVAVLKFWHEGNLMYMKDTTVTPALQWVYQKSQ
ncbi:hypothetical protein [Gynurincola endophyticus]|uniref:hypothetical protein n=1 Tax=Gynurincola endophyticus TaxID=2479004 RepID=UPI000F8DC9DE|nr:hypothetical protein [Gynurincola endophyticus]